MTDTELEDRVRVALRAVARATPLDVTPALRRRSPRALTIAASVVVAIAAGTVVLAVERDDATTTVTDAPPGPAATASPLPQGFDPSTASPFFSAEGDADGVAIAYLRARFPDYPEPGVSVAPSVDEGELRRARWSTSGPTEGELAGGDVFLRVVDGQWSVVAVTTDEVHLQNVEYDGERVHGVIETTGGQSLVVEVLDWRGDPLAPPTNMDGFDSEIEIDVRNPMAPTIVQVRQVGGTTLSISEVRLDPAPLPTHRDYERCLAAHTTTEKMPTPDIVGRLCAASLEGDVIGSGAGDGPTWELVATDEPTGRWVTLRARDQIGTYRIQTDGDFDSLFTQLGPCCSFAGHVAIVGTLRPGTTGMRAMLVDGTAIAGEGFEDPSNGVVHSVVLVPLRLIQNDASASVEVRLADGTFEHAADMNLAILGG